MENSMRTCPRCGTKFEDSSADASCPQCRDASSESIDEPTLDCVQSYNHDSISGLSKSPKEKDELVGQSFAHYRIDRFLGQGGMARVYLATHLSLQRPCAIKVLRTSTLQRNNKAVTAFLGEARLSAAINHPHAVTLYTIGHYAGRHYLEMEYVEGKTLSQMVKDDGAMDPLQATMLMSQISTALAAAHDMDMIHRDVKPANVMVAGGSHAKLADFGLAKQVSSSSVKNSERMAGTPNYMAPELFHGHAASRESDIYAMGVTFFSLVTGHLPVEKPSIQELIRFHAENDVLPLIDVECDKLPAGVVRVLQKSLAPDARQRYAHGSEMQEDLRAVVGELRSVEALLDEALQGTSLTPQHSNGSSRVRVPLPDGRGQTVNVECVKDSETGEEIVRVFSICAPTTQSYYERALKLNASLSHGSIAIETIDGEPHFVMVNSYPRATCDPKEIRVSLDEIAKYADHVELLLTGEDRH